MFQKLVSAARARRLWPHSRSLPPCRVAFVHVMKTAGSYVDGYLTARVFRAPGVVYNSWTQDRASDWTEEELDRLRQSAPARAYVHNHSGNWSSECVARYQADGWLVFSFVRHPGDQWCSYYHYAAKRRDEFVRQRSLDAMLRQAFEPGSNLAVRRHLDPHPSWRQHDFVDEFSAESFARLLARIGHRYDPRRRDSRNASGSRGYEHYRSTGEISAETHRLFLASDQHQEYQAILDHARRLRA